MALGGTLLILNIDGLLILNRRLRSALVRGLRFAGGIYEGICEMKGILMGVLRVFAGTQKRTSPLREGICMMRDGFVVPASAYKPLNFNVLSRGGGKRMFGFRTGCRFS
jgi:hypothetical protein